MNKIKLRMKIRFLVSVIMVLIALFLLNNNYSENIALFLVGSAFIPLLFNANDRGKILKYKKENKKNKKSKE